MADEADAGLGAKVAEARKGRGMTQSQLATSLGIKQASLSMIEGGELEVSSDMRKRLTRWVESGSGPKEKAPRGPYRRSTSVGDNEVIHKKRATIG